MLRTSCLSALLLLFLSACSAGDETPPPFGMSAEWLHEGHSSSEMLMVTPEGERPIGTAHHGVSRSQHDGRDVWVLTLAQELGRGTMRDSLFVDAATLLPIAYSNDMPGMQTIRTTYMSGGVVASDLERGAMTNRIDTVLNDPHLDAASFTSYLAVLPYAEGMDVEYPVFHYEEGAMTYRVVVADRVTIPACGGNADTWMIDVTTQVNTTRYWIDAASREILRVEVDLGGGNTFEQRVICG